jgi:hypothetical protein
VSPIHGKKNRRRIFALTQNEGGTIARDFFRTHDAPDCAGHA